MEVEKRCSDKFIKEGLKDGSGKKFNEAIRCLKEACYHNIRKWVMANNGDSEDADEVLQESFVRLLEILYKKKMEFTSTVCAFLFKVAKHVWLDELKRKGRFQPIDSEPQPDPEMEQLALLFEEEKQLDILWKCFGKLSQNCQDIIWDFYINKLSMEEIAKKQGHKDEKVSKQRKYVCMEKLKECAGDVYNKLNNGK